MAQVPDGIFDMVRAICSVRYFVCSGLIFVKGTCLEDPSPRLRVDWAAQQEFARNTDSVAYECTWEIIYFFLDTS
jgi:hypothetical protein